MAPIITKEDADALRKYPTVRIWLRGKSPRTQSSYLRFLARLTMQIEDSPDGLVRLVKRQDEERLADLVKDFSAEYYGTQVANCKTAIRGFFLANGCHLPKDVSRNKGARKR